jgi:transcriptional regulator with XRE-family HTH domain
MELKMLLGQRIKEARAERGLTQGDLARKTGIHQKAIFKYENGQVLPNAENLKKLAEALEICTDYLLFEHAEMTGIPKVSQPGLYERYLVLESLSDEERNAAIVLLDALIARRQLKSLAQRV